MSATAAHPLALVEDELRLVEDYIQSHLQSPVRRLADLGGHVLHSGGKRLRPALTLMAHRAAGGREVERAVAIASAMELVHMATLVHDDVVDGTETRRGSPTAGVAFGNAATVLSGDFMLSRAMRILAEDGDLAIIRCVANVTCQMSEGEVDQVFLRGQWDVPESRYYQVIERKTAAFLSGCARAGGLLAGSHSDALADYGYHLGMAFQMADDLLDYQGAQAETGKALGTDFKDGSATLPLIHWIHHDPEAGRWRSAFGTGQLPSDWDSMVDKMSTAGSLAYVRDCATKHAERAKQALQRLPESDALLALLAAADFVAARNH